MLSVKKIICRCNSQNKLYICSTSLSMGCFLTVKNTKMSEEQNRATTSEKVKAAMKREGRKYTWLAEQLGISRVALYDRLKDNSWSIGELINLKRLLNIG